MSKATIHEAARRIPVIGDYDVVVVGGGIAGVAAALAAARNGARTALIEKENGLGGLATLGMVVFYLPLCDGRGRQVIGGLGEELLKLSIKYGPGEIPRAWRRPASCAARSKQRYDLKFNPASFTIALEERALQDGVTLLYDTRFCAVSTHRGRVEAVIVENKSGRCAVRCGVVVDASGDADVCHEAGENTVSLDTNRSSSWFFAWQKDHLQLWGLGDPYWKALPRGRRTYAGDQWEDVTAMDIEAHRITLKKIQELRGSRSWNDYYPVTVTSIPQYRMTRRLQGGLELDETDDKRWFDDAVGMTGDWRNAGPVFCLPFRSLIGVRFGNLITAGRCISATTSAWDITRAIPTCAVTGEAAGTAAAMAARQGKALAALDVRRLQQRLRRQGVILDSRLCRPEAKSLSASRKETK